MSDTSYSDSSGVNVYSGDAAANADAGFGSGSQGADVQAGDVRPSGPTPTPSYSGDSVGSPSYDVASGTFGGQTTTSDSYFKQYGFNSPIGPGSGMEGHSFPYTEWSNIAADTFGIPRNIYFALIQKESSWQHTDANGNVIVSKPQLVNGVREGGGAVGFAQVLPATGTALGYDVTNPIQNLFAGTSYLSLMRDGLMPARNGDIVSAGVGPAPNWQIALARYNATPQTQTDFVGYGRDVLKIAGEFAPEAPGTAATPGSSPGAGSKPNSGTVFGITIPKIFQPTPPAGTPASAPEAPSAFPTIKTIATGVKTAVENAAIKSILTGGNPDVTSGSITGAQTGQTVDTGGLLNFVSAGSAKANQPRTSAGSAINPSSDFLIPPIPGLGFPGVRKSTGNLATDVAKDAGLSIDWQGIIPLAAVGLLAILFLTIGVKSLLSSE